MRHIWIIALTAAVLWKSPAWSFSCDEIPFSSTVLDDGTKIGVYVSDQQIEQTPKWSPQSGAPPLSLIQAIEIATEWADKEYNRFDNVEVYSIDLRRIGCRRAGEHWVYMFHFTPVMEGERLWGSRYFAAVLMDGNVIQPKKSP